LPRRRGREKRWKKTPSHRQRDPIVDGGAPIPALCRARLGGSSRLLRTVRAWDPCGAGVSGSGSYSRVRWVAGATAMAVQRQAVHTKRDRQQIQMLTFVTERVRPSQPQRVVKGPVDRLGIVPPPIEPREIGIRRRNGTHVLRAVELSFRVLIGRMETHSHAPAAEPTTTPGAG
jgi:hypothetical protein